MAWPPTQPSAVLATDVTAQTTRHPDDHNKIAALLALLTPGTWVNISASGGAAPAFNSPWANYGGVFSPARFRREAGDVCRMQGLVQGGAIGASIFTLPIGFRPVTYARSFQQVQATTAPSFIGYVDVTPAGTVLPTVTAGSGVLVAVNLDMTFVIDPAQL